MLNPKNLRSLSLTLIDPLDRSTDQETLGQAGAVYKRKWELTGHRQHLETALDYYLRGHQQGVVNDFGYTAVNAAFVLDLLADLAESGARPAAASHALAEQRRQQAQTIRQEIARALPPLVANPDTAWLAGKWWFLVTLGEACFGLERYDEAGQWFKKAVALPDVPDWECETTARQLATLLRLKQKLPAAQRGEGQAQGERVLRDFLGANFAAVTSVMQGKIGLALSGGGFRASLFHIGVLAKLAELDLLRSVEYLSCVSGGSIIGAHYYLEVRHLLQTKADRDITGEDYVQIVERVQRDFLAGVSRNIRTRIAAEWLTNLKMIFLPNYSRTLRAGELYESEIFSRVNDGEGRQRRWLNRLRVRPKGDENCVPKDNNWRRAAKVPILVLNATTLNTGHNWQFTASWMGEPPTGLDAEIDANYRLRRMYYHQLPEGRREMRLGHAVAASACVPGLFEPLTLPDLYEREGHPIDIRLVDGGVHDNQGITALLEQGCNILLVSDASGQMDSQDNPSAGLLGVPLRSNSILQARVRSAQFEDLEARRRAGLLRGLMFVHLKEALGSEPLDWIACQDKSDPVRQDPLLPYGIQRDVQRKLAAIRTDLDSFSETEAYALMTSGYCMSEHALREPILGFATPRAACHDWDFLKIKPLLEQPAENSGLMKQLKVADQLAFRIWLLSRLLQIVGAVLAVGLFVPVVYLGVRFRSNVLFSLTVGQILAGLVGVALAAAGWKPLAKAIRFRKTFQSILLGFGMAALGFLLARVHLHCFDRWFLRRGRLARLLKTE